MKQVTQPLPDSTAKVCYIKSLHISPDLGYGLRKNNLILLCNSKYFKLKFKLKIMITNKQRSFVIYGLAALLLVIPFIGMQFTKKINWSGFDFLIAGILLFGTAFCVDMILKMEKKNAKRMFYIVLILLALFLIWAELAVGIFGSPVAGS